MSPLGRVTNTGMSSRIHAVPLSMHTNRINAIECHQLIHVSEDQHIGVEIDNALELRESKDGQLGPGLVETFVLKILGYFRAEVGHLDGGYPAGLERLDT